MDAVEANLGRKPAEASADSGYCSEANLAGLEAREIDGYVATGQAKDAVAGAALAPEAQTKAKATRVEAMRAKIKSGGHASPYRPRKQVVEPVFGQIKQARGFRQFLLRGIEKVRCMGDGLHRPQPAEAAPGAGSVRSGADEFAFRQNRRKTKGVGRIAARVIERLVARPPLSMRHPALPLGSST